MPKSPHARPNGRYKRPFDLAVLAVAGIALAPAWVPFCLFVTLAIRLEDSGPVIHAQRRVGYRGKTFRMYKFRTMVVGAESRTGPVLASRADRRTTRIGAWMRRRHIDELPQLINVLRGEMSLVGPRPERPELFCRILERLPEFGSRLNAPPGIAGLAQARGSYHSGPRVKLRYDRLYLASMGPWLDAKLLLACVVRAWFTRPHRSKRRRRPPKETAAMPHRPAQVNGSSRRRRARIR